jgi:D-aminopeptidase
VRAMRGAAGVPPLVFQTPVTLEVDFTNPESARALEGMEGVERAGEMSIRMQGQSVLAAYRLFVTARERAAELRAAPATEPPQPDTTSSSACS